MAKTFDNDQKNAINIDINSVVSAGAGSGKTTVLSERFLHLINEKNCNADEILTLTFTKKATVEMSDRIYKVLKANKPEQAANFYKANIKTLDAYCANIAKQGAHFYGISPDFTQDADTILAQANAMALPFILEHRENPAIKILVDTKNYAEIASSIFVSPIIHHSTITAPIDFDRCLEKQCAEVVSVWNQSVKSITSGYSVINEELQNFGGNKNSATFKKIETGFSKVSEPFETLINRDTIYSHEFEDVREFIKAAGQLNALPLPGNLKGLDVYRDAVSEIRKIYGTLQALYNYIYGFEMTQALIPLLKEFQDKIQDYKRQSGLLSFNDIADLAIFTLKDHQEIRQIEKEKYKAIMIDEFQDNNAKQRDLLFLLAEDLSSHEKGIPPVEKLCKDKLFFVGDEKQSIYRFRGADVSVFRELSNQFPLGNLSMTTNYRSHHSLISAFNTIFGGLPYPSFPENKFTGNQETLAQLGPAPSVFYTEEMEQSLNSENEKVPDYEAVYHKVTLPAFAKEKIAETLVKKTETPEQLFAPHTHFALYDKNQEASENQLTELDAEAEWIARKIEALLKTGSKTIRVKENGTEVEKQVPLIPDDIAILLRGTKQQSVYEQALLRHGIPYNSSAATGVFSDGPVNDIFSFLRILIYSQDTMSYAKILRSPFANLSTAETNSILIESAEPFKAEGSNLSEKSLKRYNLAKKLYSDMLEFSKNNSITKIISRLWYESGYFYETIWNENVSMYNKLYDMIFTLAVKAEQNCESLAGFTDSMRAYDDDSQKIEDLDIPLEKSEGVQIMTIHKSKGLEFEIVFVAQMYKKCLSSKNSDPVYASEEYGITLNTPGDPVTGGGKANYFYNKIKDLNNAMDAAEVRRIYYVALTRAKNQLYITNGSYEPSKEPEKYIPGGENPSKQFQILEPVFDYYQKLYQQDNKILMPFDVEKIPPYDREYISAGAKRRNNRESKIKLQSEIAENRFYENADVYETENVPSIYIKPSHLYQEDDETASVQTIITKKDVPYADVNEVVYSTIPEDKKTEYLNSNGENNQIQPLFGFNNFGTIAHAFLEAGINGKEAEISAKDLLGLEDDQKKITVIMNACRNMQEVFLNSDLGKQASSSEWHKEEYTFRSRVENKIIKGTIDLVFRNQDGTFTIVDYKTNQSIEPEIYYTQLACYRQAISQMLNINADSIKCFLYYLRFGKAVDITVECEKINISEAVLQQEE